MSHETELIGSFRFHSEFATAVELLSSAGIDPAPLLTAQIPLAEAERAFEVRQRQKADAEGYPCTVEVIRA